MKKYFIGMLALVLAVGFSAFTKPNTNVFFSFQGSGTDFENASIVADVSNWAQATTCASNNDQKACTIEIADAKYYHFDNALGANILNDAAYEAAINNPSIALEAVLSTQGYTTSLPFPVTTYYVQASGPVVTKFNQVR